MLSEAPVDDIPIQQNRDFELIQTWKTDTLGVVKVFHSTSKGKYVLSKDFNLSAKLKMI